MTLSENQLARLRWDCRRGMLELDILLLPFFEQCFSHLSEVEQAVFVQYVSQSDVDLFDWLVSQNLPADESFRQMTISILNHAKPRD